MEVTKSVEHKEKQKQKQKTWRNPKGPMGSPLGAPNILWGSLRRGREGKRKRIFEEIIVADF